MDAVTGGRPGKDLVLILARELASNVSTPILVVDARGTLVYFNEAAEKILGQTFQETGELTAEELIKTFRPQRLDGTPMPPDEMPLVTAAARRQPDHAELILTGMDGRTHRVEATAFPLLSYADNLVGAVTVFWGDGEAGRPRPASPTVPGS